MKKTLLKIIMVGISLTLGACMAKDSEISTAKTTAQLANVPGRHFTSLSVHPNSEEILFLEFKPDELPSVSRLLRYHLKTGELRYYDLAKEYVYLDASFSPSGKYIVMRRAPNVQGNEDVKRQAYANSEIVMMNSDGTDLKVIPLKAGLKMAPVMSHDDKHIAYWRATQRPDGSKSFAANFDVWEVDLRTGKEQPFAGLYEFFSGGQMQYLNDNSSLLISSDTPMSVNMPGRNKGNFSIWQYEYEKKYKGSHIYLLKRFDNYLPEPLMTEINYPVRTSIDKNGGIFFEGQNPKISFFRKNSDGKLMQWNYPWSVLGDALEIVALPDGFSIVFIFNYHESPKMQCGIAVFNLKNEVWAQLNIPSLNSATSIRIKNSL